MAKIMLNQSSRNRGLCPNRVVNQGDCAFLRKDRSAGSASKKGERFSFSYNDDYRWRLAMTSVVIFSFWSELINGIQHKFN